MEWWLVLLIFIGSFILLMLTGMPVAFAFFILNLIGLFIYFGGEAGLKQFITSINSSLTVFTLLPVPLFVLMGEVMFRSGVAPKMMDTLDMWIGRLPGRLSLLAVAGGTLFATLTGSSWASTAMLGQTLLPDMEKRGYANPMSLGPILGSGGLALMIPPSTMAVIMAVIGRLSVGKVLIAIVVPGLLMALIYAGYIILRCRLQPSIAPPYMVTPTRLLKKIVAAVRYILPLGLVIFAVLGLIFLGIATPSEAAATGAISTIVLAAAYKQLSWGMMKSSIIETLRITGMTFMILAGAEAYSQILAASGATRGLIEFTTGLSVMPVFIIITMMVVLLFMGMFMSTTAIMMITLPPFLQIITGLGFDPIWFGVLTLLQVEMAQTTPPYGIGLFVMKGVAPHHTMMEINRAALPFIGCDLVSLALIIAFPSIALWLPGLMMR
ncbi:MAG: TRAP transporter large permease subunit [Chloroflexi bacterium]|nr:TRAP transporter large permease subunit [Chloroflexota bacterium]